MRLGFRSSKYFLFPCRGHCLSVLYLSAERYTLWCSPENMIMYKGWWKCHFDIECFAKCGLEQISDFNERNVIIITNGENLGQAFQSTEVHWQHTIMSLWALLKLWFKLNLTIIIFLYFCMLFRDHLLVPIAVHCDNALLMTNDVCTCVRST